jgi:MFS family permease
MLVVTTGAILITSIDRAPLPTVLPGILKELSLSETAGGVLVGLSFAGKMAGGLILGVFDDSLGRGHSGDLGHRYGRIADALAAENPAVRHGLRDGWYGARQRGHGRRVVAERGQGLRRRYTPHRISIGQFVGPLLIGTVLVVGTWRSVFLFLPLLAIPIVILELVLARRENLRRVNAWIEEHDMTPSVTEHELDEERGERPVATAWEAVKLALAERNVRLSVVANFLFLWAETDVVSFLTLQLTREAGLSLAAVSSGSPVRAVALVPR